MQRRKRPGERVVETGETPVGERLDVMLAELLVGVGVVKRQEPLKILARCPVELGLDDVGVLVPRLVAGQRPLAKAVGVASARRDFAIEHARNDREREAAPDVDAAVTTGLQVQVAR